MQHENVSQVGADVTSEDDAAANSVISVEIMVELSEVSVVETCVLVAGTGDQEILTLSVVTSPGFIGANVLNENGITLFYCTKSFSLSFTSKLAQERLKKETIKISVRTVRKGKSKGKSFQDTTKIRLKLPM